MKRVFYFLIGVPLLIIVYWSFIRLIRRIHPFPVPEPITKLIDNPVRRRFIQPPADMPARLGIEPGMTVLEVGPGSGTYTAAIARHLGPEGRLVSIDIEPRIIERLCERAYAERLANVEARVADVFDLPYPDRTFDVIYMIAVIGEIPTPERALAEFARVLKPDGRLAFSELIPDPDFPLPRTLDRWATAGGFMPVELNWHRLSYEKWYRHAG